MKIKNMTGYMLGNRNNVHQVGDAWSNTDCRVWVCTSLDKAKQILFDSQEKSCLDPHCVWTTIYQVSARNLVCEKTHNGMLYTNMPTKIVTDRVVFHKEARKNTDEELLVNARKYHGRFAELMLSLQQENVK